MKKALMLANVASMIDLFNKDNIRILQELGYEVFVACNFENGSVSSEQRLKEFKEELFTQGVQIMEVPIPRSVGKIKDMIRSYQILRKSIKENKFEIVHCQSPFGGVLARLACKPFRKKGTKVIYFAHGFHFFKGASWINWLIYYNIERICAKYTDCLITINKEDYKRASLKLKAKKVVLFPGAGVNLTLIQKTKVNRVQKCIELGLPTDVNIILDVCELSVRKNCETAIRAFARASHENTILVFCGIGSKLEELEKIAQELGVRHKVYFLGFRTDVLEVMNIADVFVFPSKQEGLPMALMQAMAFGLPVVCSDIRGNHDLVQDGKGGFLLSPFDEVGFAKCINKLLDNKKLCMKMGKINTEVMRKYDQEKVNRQMKKVYLSLLK